MRSDRGSVVKILVAAAAVALAVAACGPTPPPTTAAPTEPPVSPTPIASTSPSPSAAPSPSVAIPPSLPPDVAVDPGLLEVLPAEIEGIALEPDPDTAAGIAADPLLAASALSIVVGLAASPSLEADDLAVAAVIRLRPDVFDEAFYQEWRDTYNEAACEVTDGVETETSTEIGGHTTYVGLCAGGVETFHTYLEDQGFIVSVTSTGDRRLGEQVIAGIAS